MIVLALLKGAAKPIFRVQCPKCGLVYITSGTKAEIARRVACRSCSSRRLSILLRAQGSLAPERETKP